jgi:hypothetical protein
VIESVEQLDLLILKDYSEDINTVYNLNAIPGQKYIDHLPCLVDIDEVDSQPFINAWEYLMSRFKIPSKHHSYILFITQTFYSKLNLENDYLYDITNAVNVLDFFIGYLNEASIAQVKGKFTDLNSAIDNKLQLQIKSPHSGLPITLNYPTAARFAVDHLYKSLKEHDPILREALSKYKTLPAIEILKELKNSLQINLDHPYQYYLIETIKILQRYLNTYLSKELSRKQHLFLFELLYLFNFLHHAGKVNNTYGSDFNLNSKSPNRKFSPTVRTSDSDKSAFIKSLIKNSNRNLRYHLQTNL